MREGCYVVVTVSRKGVTRRSPDIFRGNFGAFASGFLAGLHGMHREGKEIISGHLTDVRVSYQGVFQAAAVASGGWGV
jgi:hypothetical protein